MRTFVSLQFPLSSIARRPHEGGRAALSSEQQESLGGAVEVLRPEPIHQGKSLTGNGLGPRTIAHTAGVWGVVMAGSGTPEGLSHVAGQGTMLHVMRTNSSGSDCSM